MNIYRQTWEELIIESKPNMFITITFKEMYDLGEKKAYELLNRLLHYVNEDLFGKKYKQKCEYLSGFGCCENQFNLTPHFHLILNNNNVDACKINHSFLGKIDKFHQMSTLGFDFQEINNEEVLASYITKTITEYTHDRIFPLGKDGAYRT